MTLAQLTIQLHSWIEQFQQPVTLVSDSENWDWRWISAIFAGLCHWPSNLARQPLIMPAEAQLAAAIAQGDQQQRALRHHHALDDARAEFKTGMDNEPTQHATAVPTLSTLVCPAIALWL